MVKIYTIFPSIILIAILKVSLSLYGRVLLPGVNTTFQGMILLNSGATVLVEEDTEGFKVTQCIGLLVDRYWVMTVATCVSTAAKKEYPYFFVKICAGLERNVKNTCLYEYERRPTYIILHDKFNEKPTIPEFNVAMLKIHRRFSSYSTLPTVPNYRSKQIIKYFSISYFDQCTVHVTSYITKNELIQRTMSVKMVRACKAGDPHHHYCANEDSKDFHLCMEDLGSILVCNGSAIGMITTCSKACLACAKFDSEYLRFVNVGELQEWRNQIIQTDYGVLSKSQRAVVSNGPSILLSLLFTVGFKISSTTN